MPSRDEHNKLCIELTGNYILCNTINAEKDQYAKEIPGCAHRIKGHGLRSEIVHLLKYGWDGFVISRLHDKIDGEQGNCRIP